MYLASQEVEHTPEVIRKVVTEIVEPHPYMAEYEEQLVNDDISVDDYLNPMFTQPVADSFAKHPMPGNLSSLNISVGHPLWMSVLSV